jgi:hypothetical protein
VIVFKTLQRAAALQNLETAHRMERKEVERSAA